MPPRPGNFLVGEEVLQLRRPGYSNGLKPVPGPPMPEHNPPTNLIEIKDFPSHLRPRPTVCPLPGHAPRNLFTRKQNLPGSASQTDLALVRPGLRGSRFLKMKLPASHRIAP